MRTFQGRGVVKGRAVGPALISDRPVNFTAAFTKPLNIVPYFRAEFLDRHHPWFKTNIKGRVLVFPTAIGSTHTGLVLLDLVRLQAGPAALIVDQADPLMVSGVLLSEVWYQRAIPVVEYPTAEIADAARDGDLVEVDGASGTVALR